MLLTRSSSFSYKSYNNLSTIPAAPCLVLDFLCPLLQGERLSHAVGCAFAACLERKQKREKECGVTATFDANRTTFTREGSFRVTTATEAAEREEVMRQLQDAKKGVFFKKKKKSRKAAHDKNWCFIVLSSPNSRDGRQRRRELVHRWDKLKPDRKLVLPLIVPSFLRGHPGTSGDTTPTRAGRRHRQAGLLQGLPGTQPEDVSLQATAVAAHERAAVHHAAKVRLPHEEHG